MRRDGVANRERILAAAVDVFGARGADAATDEVARQAEVGIATVFRHFPTKQELVEAAAVRYLEGLEHETSRLLDEGEPGPALVSVMRLLVSTGPTKVTLLNLLLAGGGGLTAPVDDAVHTIRNEVRQILERAQGAGAARPDVTSDDVLTLARALAHVATPNQDAAVDRALGMVLDGLGVQR